MKKLKNREHNLIESLGAYNGNVNEYSSTDNNFFTVGQGRKWDAVFVYTATLFTSFSWLHIDNVNS